VCFGIARPSEDVRRLAERFADSVAKTHEVNTRELPAPKISKTSQWSHQRIGYHFAYSLDAAMMALEMGCGKSLVAVDLVCNWDCHTILVLCPTSVRGVWRREFERHAGRDIEVVAIKLAQARREPVAIIVNYETAWRGDFADFSLGIEWDAVICDESHKLKSHDSAVSKYAAKLAKRAKRRLCLTGTPLAQSPLDLFGQFRFLDPGLFGTSWFHFRNRYAVMGNPSIPQQITGYKNQDELQQRMGLITYRCKAEDVLDLPEALHEERTCELCPAARKAYRQLEEELIAEIGNGVVTASNALVKLLRLQQLASGFLIEDQQHESQTEAQRFHRLDTGKQELLGDLLESAGGEPFVVFCRFRPDLAAVRGLCDSLGLRYGELSGDTRDGLTDRAEMSPNINVLGVQIQSGGVGIDLTRARYACYYSVGFSLSEYEQSLARLHRPGQKHNVTYYHLIAEKTVDRRLYKALEARKNVIEAVLEGLNNGGNDE
jgi:SNF2 family DNA or RNA helicase